MKPQKKTKKGGGGPELRPQVREACKDKVRGGTASSNEPIPRHRGTEGMKIMRPCICMLLEICKDGLGMS